MKLYGRLASPYVARVAFLLKLKNIDFTTSEAPGGLGSAEYSAISPLGKIPALEHNGHIIVESEVICEYIEECFPEPPLLPSSAVLKANSRMISRMVDLYVAPHNTPLLRMRDPADRDQAVIDTAAANFAKGFAAIERIMLGPFAVGDAVSIADCALLPFILMLKGNVFKDFADVVDPTEGDRKLALWWRSLQKDPTIRQLIEDYQQDYEEFMAFLMKMLAMRS